MLIEREHFKLFANNGYVFVLAKTSDKQLTAFVLDKAALQTIHDGKELMGLGFEYDCERMNDLSEDELLTTLLKDRLYMEQGDGKAFSDDRLNIQMVPGCSDVLIRYFIPVTENLGEGPYRHTETKLSGTDWYDLLMATTESRPMSINNAFD